MEKDLISVVVPVYGVEEYIEELILSLKNQTYEKYEVLLVDDGSKDSSIKIATALINKYSLDKFKILHKTNGGLSDARNFGTEHAKGEYITYVDSDDYVREDYLELLHSAMISNDADVVIGSFKYFNQNKNEVEKVISESYYETIYSDENKDQIFKDMYLNINKYPISLVTAWSKLYKTKILKDNDIKYPYGKFHEDEFTTYKIYLKSNKIVYINEDIYIYRVRDNSIMTMGYNEKSIDILDALEERINVFKSSGVDTLETEYHYALSLFRHYNKRKIFLNKKDIEIKKEAEKEFKKVFSKLSLKKRLKLILAKYFGFILFKFR